VDVDVLSVYPHAHYLGKEMQASAALPDGTTRRLLSIKRWDFHWQQEYRYQKPIALPRGTTLTMKYTYDNSAGNPHNPHKPPKPVVYGPNSSDEMGDLWIQVLPRSSADAATLVRAFAEREARANVAGAELLVRRVPEDAKNQTFLGSSYVESGRFAEAIPPLEHALRLDPRSAQRAQPAGRRAGLARARGARRSRTSARPPRSRPTTSGCSSTWVRAECRRTAGRRRAGIPAGDRHQSGLWRGARQPWRLPAVAQPAGRGDRAS
jgi:hypothetical protein